MSNIKAVANVYAQTHQCGQLLYTEHCAALHNMLPSISVVTLPALCRSSVAHIDRTAAQHAASTKPDCYSMYHSKALQEELRRLDAQEQLTKAHR